MGVDPDRRVEFAPAAGHELPLEGEGAFIPDRMKHAPERASLVQSYEYRHRLADEVDRRHAEHFCCRQVHASHQSRPIGAQHPVGGQVEHLLDRGSLDSERVAHLRERSAAFFVSLARRPQLPEQLAELLHGLLDALFAALLDIARPLHGVAGKGAGRLDLQVPFVGFHGED